MGTRVDLRQLAVERDGPVAPALHRRHLLTRFVLPGVLLVGFGLLLAFAARETLSPPRPVTVVPVIWSQAGGQQAVDTPLFRAAGWVEPRPTPTLVTALTEGVLERLLVVEGQEVKEGEVIARLMTADIQLVLQAAEADVMLREGALAAARAAQTAAKARLDRPIHLQVDLAEADAVLARAETERANLAFQLKAAQVRQRFAQEDAEAKQKSQASIPEFTVRKARSDLEAANAALEELQARQQRLPVEIAALKAKRDALSQKLQSRIDEIRQAAEADALVQTAEARLTQAQVARDTARLRLERTEVKATAAGRVLNLVARPGIRLNGLNPGSLHDSSTVLSLYDPARLQVRVDVRLDDVGKVQPGQKVRIDTAALPGSTLEGEVLMATSQADIQKNTLSFKVAIANPPSPLKPDMLCQVTFLAPPRSLDPAKGDTEPYRLLVPRQLIDASAEGSRVWVADRLTGTARLRRVEIGMSRGDLVEVVTGLASSDKLIVGGRDGLKDGDRIKVVAEDENLGITKVAGH